jgi:DNA-binding response OmpR family regulator
LRSFALTCPALLLSSALSFAPAVPASQEFPAGTAPSVLLVEEYDALAAAIRSALKKFAPRERVRVVETLSEAEAIMAESSPRLLIIDFDPPRSDAIEFFQKVRAVHGETRLLAIASGVPPELNSERPAPNAFHFVEKPFDLAELGAAVQALLGPWTNTNSGDSRGTLRDLGGRDLIPLQCLNLATAVLHLRSPDDRAGEIHFLDGQITHATTGNFIGPGALQQMLRWKNPHARETERLVDALRTIHGAWHSIFFEAIRHVEVEPRPTAEVPAPPPVRESPKPDAKKGKKVLVIDDTEMLLIFVEDTLAISDPTLQIVTAFTGSEGLRRTEVMLPDLVLLDYSLPDLRGDQVCERLLQNETTARIPIVMMSGHVAEMAATARKYGNVVATIAKPFLSDALVALIQETLAKGPLLSAPETRQGNGKKPPKKNGAAPAKSIVEKPLVSPKPSAPVVPPVPPVAPPPPVLQPVPTAVEPLPSPVVVPPPPVISTPPPQAPPAPAAPPRQEAPPAAVQTAQLPASNGSSVVLGLGLEVIAVQFNQRFQIGTIRARPTASGLSLTHSSAPSENLLAGFEIGPVDLDAQGRIRTLRVFPTRRPATPVQTRSHFEINDVALVNQNAPIQLTAGPASPMTMAVVAMFKVASVELSDLFEVAQLVLEPAGTRFRVILDPQSRTATEFDAAQVRLDSSNHIAEFVLNAAPG